VLDNSPKEDIMKTRKRIALGLGSTVLVLGAGAGIATGASSNAGGPPGGGGPPGVAAIASYLGLTTSQLGADLKAGQTLAQIATAQGKTVGGLEAAIEADAKSHLDADVASGKITAADEASMLAGLQSHVDDMVNSSGPPAGGHGSGGPGGPGGGPASQAVADYLGLTVAQLRTDLQDGQTLAQIATAQGKTVSGLEAAIEADAKTHLDAAVAAGKLTSAQETSMLSGLQSHVDDAVNSTGPPADGPRDGPPPQF
jgi:hypothetical protein